MRGIADPIAWVYSTNLKGGLWPAFQGSELLVLDGGFREGGEEFTQHSRLKLPAGSTLRAAAGLKNCRVWVKSGHLAA